MTADEALARRLAQELRAELAGLHRLAEELRSAPLAEDTYARRARASILHDFYTGAERIFARIAEELDGGLPRGEQWHRQLLQDMALELPGVRPSVITQVLAGELGPYMRFRHVFRNVYGYALDGERMQPLMERLDDTLGQFAGQVEAFIAWMLGQP